MKNVVIANKQTTVMNSYQKNPPEDPNKISCVVLKRYTWHFDLKQRLSSECIQSMQDTTIRKNNKEDRVNGTNRPGTI